MDEVQQQPRIETHRTTDIADDDQGPRLMLNFTPGQFKNFASIFEVAAHDTAHIWIRPPARWSFTMRRALAQVPAHLGHQLFGFLHLFPREGLKILLSQHLYSAIGLPLRC